MVLALKRKRAQVSYREETSSEDNSHDTQSEEDSIEPETPRIPQSSRRSPRKLQRSLNNAQSAARRSPRSQKLGRSSRKRVSYKEPSSDIDDDIDFSPPSPPYKQQRPAKASRVSRAPRVSSASSHQHSIPQKRRPKPGRPKTKHKAFARVLSQNVKQEKVASVPILSDGVLPTWTQLPYHILLQVLVYASHPVQDNSSWLLSVAKLHRNLVEPALTALYRTPPVTSLAKSQHVKLMQLLIEPSEKRLFEYNRKIYRLELDATNMLSYTSASGASFDLPELVTVLPMLQSLEIFDPGDKPPYRKRTRSIRWHYPDALFSALQDSNTHLKSWRWNASLFFKQHPLAWMSQIHGTSSFSTIKQMSFCNYAQDEKRLSVDEDVVPTRGEALASAIALLPCLKALNFESCPLIDGDFLQLLPNSLSALEITNCINVSADGLRTFMQGHGKDLRELTLNHNQSLSLSFLPALRESCPHLETLTMDLNYYSTFNTSHDADPKYDLLLAPEEKPTWPISLRSMELLYLRKWSTEAAEVFLQSIVDAAEELSNIRSIIIKATGILDISWRDRARLRDEWVARLQKVFLNRNKPPNPNLVSLRAYREWKAANDSPTRAEADTVSKEPAPFVRQFSHVQITPKVSRNNSHSAESDSDSDAPLLPQARRVHGPNQRELRPRTSETLAESDSSDETEESDDESEDGLFIQGRCNIVDISIDNIRPAEFMYHEEDFLDAEISGDEDWNEGNEVIDEHTSYAW